MVFYQSRLSYQMNEIIIQTKKGDHTCNQYIYYEDIDISVKDGADDCEKVWRSQSYTVV